MNSQALILMISVMTLDTGFTLYFLIKVLKKK